MIMKTRRTKIKRIIYVESQKKETESTYDDKETGVIFILFLIQTNLII